MRAGPHPHTLRSLTLAILFGVSQPFGSATLLGRLTVLSIGVARDRQASLTSDFLKPWWSGFDWRARREDALHSSFALVEFVIGHDVHLVEIRAAKLHVVHWSPHRRRNDGVALADLIENLDAQSCP